MVKVINISNDIKTLHTAGLPVSTAVDVAESRGHLRADNPFGTIVFGMIPREVDTPIKGLGDYGVVTRPKLPNDK